MTMPLPLLEDVFRFIWKETTDTKSRLVRIGGIQNHIHLLVDLHPTVALSDFVRTIKAHSSAWMRSDERFTHFNGWAKEYFAASASEKEAPAIINYIRGQREHHLGTDFVSELKQLCGDSGQTYDERDMQ